MDSLDSLVRSLAEREDLLAEIHELDKRASPRGAGNVADDDGLNLLLARLDLEEEEGRSSQPSDLTYD